MVVSTNAIVKQNKTAVFILRHLSHENSECLLWPYGRDSGGYARAKVPGFSTRLAHRIMCELANGRKPFAGALARHKCGNGHLGCVNPRHLAWGSAQDNANDALSHGTVPRGEQNAKSVLKLEDVLRIRIMSAEGLSQRKIADQFGISPATVQAIIEGRTWRETKRAGFDERAVE